MQLYLVLEMSVERQNSAFKKINRVNNTSWCCKNTMPTLTLYVNGIENSI